MSSGAEKLLPDPLDPLVPPLVPQLGPQEGRRPSGRPSRRPAVPEAAAETPAEAVGDEQAERNQAEQHHPHPGLLLDQQEQAQGQGAEIDQAQDPEQGPGPGLTQQSRAAPHAPAGPEGAQRVLLGLKIWDLRRLQDGDEDKARGAADGGGGGGGGGAQTRVADQGAQKSGTEKQLRVLRLDLKVPLAPLVPRLPTPEDQDLQQLAVVREAADVSWEPGEAAAERTHHSPQRSPPPRSWSLERHLEHRRWRHSRTWGLCRPRL